MFEKRCSQDQPAWEHQLRCLWGAGGGRGTLMSFVMLPHTASILNPTSGRAKGHYQLMAFCSLERAGSCSLSFPVWADVLSALGPPGAIQQKVLEHLGVPGGWHGTGS